MTLSYRLYYNTYNIAYDNLRNLFPPHQQDLKWDKVVEVINNLNKRFYSEWLPTAEYEQANGMNFEVYGGDSDMGYVELWYAVKKKV